MNVKFSAVSSLIQINLQKEHYIRIKMSLFLPEITFCKRSKNTVHFLLFQRRRPWYVICFIKRRKMLLNDGITISPGLPNNIYFSHLQNKWIHCSYSIAAGFSTNDITWFFKYGGNQCLLSCCNGMFFFFLSSTHYMIYFLPLNLKD